MLPENYDEITNALAKIRARGEALGIEPEDMPQFIEQEAVKYGIFEERPVITDPLDEFFHGLKIKRAMPRDELIDIFEREYGSRPTKHKFTARARKHGFEPIYRPVPEGGWVRFLRPSS